jgi:hypothetical protein
MVVGMLASHDLAEKMSESLWHSASLVVEILLISHWFFLSVLIWESIWMPAPLLCHLNVL